MLRTSQIAALMLTVLIGNSGCGQSGPSAADAINHERLSQSNAKADQRVGKTLDDPVRLLKEPGFYPAIVLVFMALASLVLVLQDFIAQGPAGANKPAPAQAKRNFALVFASFVVVAIYIALLPLFGFRVATALFVAAFQLVLERPTTLRQWAIQLTIAVGTAAITYLVFERYLSVILPRGSWTGW